MYDDYFRNYSPYPTYQNGYDEYLDYENDFYSMDNDYDRFMTRQVNNSSYNYDFNRDYMDFSSMYPEIYKHISPIIEKKLSSSALRSIDNSALDKLTFEVYDEIAKTDIGKKLNIQVNSVRTGCTTSGCGQNSGIGSNSISNSSGRLNFSQNSNSKITNQGMSKYTPTSTPNNKDNVKEVSNQPARSNCLLCDLIKIMILNNLIGNQKPPKPGPRPPFPPNNRPPRPGMPSNRQPYSGQNISRSTGNTRPSYFDVPYPEDFSY